MMSNKTGNAYRSTVFLNSLVLLYIRTWKKTKSNKALARLFNLLLPITLQEVHSVVSKLSLGRDLVEDMKQDSFFKLLEALDNYDPERNPVFITFWRRCVKNDLLTKYFSSQNPEELVLDPPAKGPQVPIDALLVTELLVHYQKELDDHTLAMKPSTIQLVSAIITKRILVAPSLKTKQANLAAEFSVTQGYVSRWERWLLGRIREDFKELT